MMQLVDQFKQTTYLRWNRVYSFKPRIRINLEYGPYIIKTAESHLELISCLKLRNKIFNEEFRNITRLGLDVDKYDRNFDHLMIQDKATRKIVGTYRLSLINKAKNSYTGQEFELKEILNSNNLCLELGRACIDINYRKGSIVLLLWRGIAEYMLKSGANTLFGCTSLKVTSTREAALVYRYLKEQNNTTTEYFSYPKAMYAMKDFDIWYMYFGKALTYYHAEEAKDLIPTLLKSYLKLGAKIVCEPAYDEEFHCIDFLTILKKENLSSLLAKKFSIE
jgi:putative hemolysin